MKLLHVFFISLYAIASASEVEFDILKFVIQTLWDHPKNWHPSIVLRREKRQIDSVATTEIVNPIADVSVTPAAEILAVPMTAIVELNLTTFEEIATTTIVPSTISVSTGDDFAFTVAAVNPSTEATTLTAETSILTDQPTVDTLENSINEATTAGVIIPSSEPTTADGETLTSISTINNVYLSSPAALETIVNVDLKQMSIPAAELISVPIQSTIPAMETTVVTVEPTAEILFEDPSIAEAVTVPLAIIPASVETASTLTLETVIPAEETTTDVDTRTTLTTKSAIPIETTTENSTPPSFPANAVEKTIEDQIKKIKDILEHSTEKQIKKVKETWAIFKFYLMDSLVPGSKLKNTAARYARFPLSNAEEVKRNVKLFTDFTERIQRKPGYQLEIVLNSWEKIQAILDSYPGVSPRKNQPDSSSKAYTTKIPNQTSIGQ